MNFLSLGRSFKFRVFCLSLLFFGAAPGLLMAQTPPPFEVTTPDDDPDADVGDGFCLTDNNECSLRAAIEESNSNPDQNIIILPPPPNGEDYVLSNGTLTINSNIRIIGEDPRTTRINANRQRGFIIDGETSIIVGFTNLQIYNGYDPGNVIGNSRAGAIFVNSNASVSLHRVYLVDNEADWNGGAIVITSSSTVLLQECEVRGNKVRRTQGNGGEGFGGAIHNGGFLRISRSTFTQNVATRGGAIANTGNLEVINSTFSRNKASFQGGAIYNEDNASIAYSTLTENEVGLLENGARLVKELAGGGAVFNWNGTVNLGNSILAGNTDHTETYDVSPDAWSKEHGGITPIFNSFRGNVFGTVDSEVWNVADPVWGDLRFDQEGFSDPELGGLLIQGGLTPTHSPLAGSPVLEKGTGTTSATFFDCPETDQRGVPRPPHSGGPNGERCDVGAFELAPQTEFMEAEAAKVFGAYFQTAVDAAASGGKYVYVPSDLPNAIEAPNEQQRLEFDINITSPGNYTIVGWARPFAPDHNSFWVRIDDQPEEAYLWDLQGNGASFLADPLSHRGENGNENNPEFDPIEKYFTKGVHTITVYLRENFTQLDRIQIVHVLAETQMLELETSAYITGDFSVVNDPAASNSQYVIHPPSKPDFADGPDDAHKILQNITVDQAGTYLIRANVFAEFDSKNSFYVKVNGLPEEGYLWDMTESNNFGLDYVSDRGNGSTGNPEQDPVEIYLSEGEHVIEIFAREAGTGIDNIGLELKSNADAKIISRNKPAYSSSNENGSLTPDKAVDGDPNTRWSSQFSEPQWIKIYLQGTYDVHRVVLDWQNSHGVEYKIQISDDAWNWTTLYHKTGGDGGTDNLIVNGTGRYIRMKGIDRSTQYGFSLWAFDVYGTSSDSSGGTGFVCEGDCLNAEPIVKDEIKVLNTTGDKWYVVNYNINGWQASEMAGRTIFVNGVQVQPGQIPLPAKVNGKYYFHFTAGEHPWASWSFWNW